MWSGPRNLSTAMMYAFAARGDCSVVDEPFYAAFLDRTGLDHPMREAVLASQSRDPAEVADALLGRVETPLFYQKHMTHHMIPGIPRDWMRGVENVFLIRHPARVVASYAKKREGPTLEDIGFVQQSELFHRVADDTGKAPVVIDSTDIRAEPDKMLKRLCSAIGVDFSPRMLRWEAGPKPFDGIWAAHWYGAVHRSCGFDAAEGDLPSLETRYARLVEQALPYYDDLRAFKL
jgi:hypothetical protein